MCHFLLVVHWNTIDFSYTTSYGLSIVHVSFAHAPLATIHYVNYRQTTDATRTNSATVSTVG